MKRFAIFILLLLPSLLFAENFYITSFDSEIEVAEDSVYTIRETIDVFFTTPSHGIYRVIPIRDETIRAEIDILSANIDYSEEENSDFLIITMGRGDEYVSGPVRYELEYTYDPGADAFSSYDEFYMNILGYWQTEVESVSFRIIFPKPIDRDMAWVTYGEFDSPKEVPVTLSSDGLVLTGSVSGLLPEENVSVRTQMEEGYYVNARVKKDYFLLILILTIALTLLLIPFATYTYRKYGVDTPPVVAVRFEPPEGFTPLDVGYLYDRACDSRDITAMLFYWADKGYIRIVEEKKKDSFRIEKVKDGTFATEYEEKLFNAFFTSGSSVTSKEVNGEAFLNDIGSVSSQVTKRFTEGEEALDDPISSKKATLSVVFTVLYALLYGFVVALEDLDVALVTCFIAVQSSVVFLSIFFRYQKRGGTGRRRMVSTIVAVTLLSLFYIFIFAIFVSTGDSAAVSLFIAVLLYAGIVTSSALAAATSKRSPYGQKLLEEVLGYRDFIERAELPELERMIRSDPDFYYHTLSFAIVFSLEEKWSRKFKDLYVQPASWYIGHSTADYLFYSSLSRRFNTSYTSRAVAPLENRRGGTGSYSGFHGRSGGGHGGGGGGSW